MTKKEMEKKIKKLEDRIIALEARPIYVPQPYPYPVGPCNPYQPFGPVTWDDHTASRPSLLDRAVVSSP